MSPLLESCVRRVPALGRRMASQRQSVGRGRTWRQAEEETLEAGAAGRKNRPDLAVGGPGLDGPVTPRRQ